MTRAFQDINPIASESAPTKVPEKTRSRLFAALFSTTSLITLIFGAVAYIPQLLTRPGWISVDTKQYLYINPSQYTQRVASIWMPNTDLGSVTHQNIGYLFPMGPWYSVFAHFDIPVWVAQRLWVGSLLFGAATGIAYLCRTLNLSGQASLAAGLVFMLSPYVLQYVEFASALLAPWSGLGWMLGLTIKAARKGGWKYVGGFGVTLALTSSINATALIYIGFAPALWLFFALFTKEIRLSRFISTFIKIGVASVAVSLWWIAGLWAEAKYGLNILKYTETEQAIASTSSAAESLRGLGYWYFYSSDSYGSILPASIPYQSWAWLVGLSFGIPALGFVSAAIIRWRSRTYFILLILVGTILSVGAHPYGSSTPFGTLFSRFISSSEAGLALRSTDRATPLIVLGIAMLLGGGIDAISRKWKFLGIAVAAVISGAAIANQPALFNGQYVPAVAARNDIPNYWYQAANYLSSKGDSTRVMQLPGQDFETYRFGTTTDPILPGLINRPVIERRQVPMGSTASVDLLDAFDNTVQLSTLNPRGVSAVARLMSAGDILITSDIAYEHYNLPPPKNVMSWFSPTPTGLSSPIGFGQPIPNYPTHGLPLWNEQTLSLPDSTPWPNPLTDFPVPNARPIVRLESPSAPVIIDGGGSGIVAAANSGLLDGNPTILYSGSYAGSPSKLQSVVTPDSTLVVTDTNRRELREWGTIRDSIGYTQTATEPLTSNNPSYAALELFPSTGTATQTVALQKGVKLITASSFGNPIGLTPEDQPTNAMDGNPDTLWLTGGFIDPIGQWLKIQFDSPVTTGTINLQQPLFVLPDRWIDQVKLTFDDKSSIVASLGASSLTRLGQTITFPTRTFSSVTITVTGLHNIVPNPIGDIGFAEVRIANKTVTVVARPPTDLLSSLGTSSQSHRLLLIYSRQRTSNFPPRTSPEINMNRQVSLPATRTFSISGNATLSSELPDQTIDILTGRSPNPPGLQPVARSIGRLPGDPGADAAAAFDGNPETAWEPGLGIGGQLGAWIEVDTPTPVTMDQVQLQILADGHHSIPESVTISTEQGMRTIFLPKNLPRSVVGNDLVLNLSFARLSGREIRLTIQSIRPATTPDYYTLEPVVLPVGIIEFDIPGVNIPNLPAQMPNVCRPDLLTLDGSPVWVKITGTTQDALSGRNLGVVGCGPNANGVTISKGSHLLETSIGKDFGFDINELVLDSAAGGASEPLTSDGYVQRAPSPEPSSHIRILSENATNVKVSIQTTGGPVWLVLGESQDSGWQAYGTIDGKKYSDLNGAKSNLIDGYANGWLINPPPGVHTIDVTLTFTPQHVIDVSLITSAGAIGLCSIFAFIPLRRRAKSRRKRKHGKSRFKWKNGTMVATRTVEETFSQSVPKLQLPLFGHNFRTSLLVAIPVSLLTGSVAGFFYLPKLGVIVAIATFLVMEVKWLRWITNIGSVAFIIAAGASITYTQATHPHTFGAGWPNTFNPQANWIWIGVLLLFADSMAAATRRKKLRSQPDSPRIPEAQTQEEISER